MSDTKPIGILLINIGTPEAPTVPAVSKYLREFLGDPNVIDLPFPLRWLLVNLIIVPLRAIKSSALYQKIWTEQGSPLLINSEKMRDDLVNELGANYEVAIGMRYGKPNIEEAVNSLLEKDCKEIIALPLFPQQSLAATGSATKKFLSIIKKTQNPPPVRIHQDFFRNPLFIDAYTSIIKETLTDNFSDFLLFSYHGIPENQINKTQCNRSMCNRMIPCSNIHENNRHCYRAQCFETSRILAHALGLKSNQYATAFQSRIGFTHWIMPYTDLVLPKLAQQKIKNLAVVCPSFVADCLESLEEIGIRAQEQWQKLGGESFKLIPCLNSHPKWIAALKDMIKPKED